MSHQHGCRCCECDAGPGKWGRPDLPIPLIADDRDPDQIIRELRDRIEELEPSLRDWKDMAMKYRTALDRVWDALTAEDKRGAFTDTLWMPDNTNTTVFEFIDHTLNPE